MVQHVLDWALLPPTGRVSLGDYLEGKIPDGLKKPYILRQKDFVIRQWMLYLRMTPSNTQEEVLALVILCIKRRACFGQMSSIHGTSGMRPDAELTEGTILVARYGKGICLGCQEL